MKMYKKSTSGNDCYVTGKIQDLDGQRLTVVNRYNSLELQCSELERKRTVRTDFTRVI